MKRPGIMLGIAIALAGAGALPAQPVPVVRTAAASPAPADGRAVVAGIRRVLSENYVLPEVRPKLDAALARGLAEGRYDTSDPAALTERINADLAAVTPDKHLGVLYDPRQAAEIAATPGGQADDGPPSPAQIRRAKLSNHGFVEMKVLPGNIRYVDLQGFNWVGAESAEAYDTAMRFLRGGDAAIIDLRNNGGGSPEAVQYLASHFMEPNRPLMTFHMGASQIDRTATLPTLPAGRMVGKPLYVLTSGHTASAAEEFAGHVAGYRLGELIGDTTAGAGFRNSFFALPGGYVISVSVGRAVLASTGKDWEGVGIAPTTTVAADKALLVAQARALRRLAASAPEAEKARYEAAAIAFIAQVDPVATALPLAAYAGTFGERKVWVEDGKLAYQREGGPKFVLIPIAPNAFVFEGDPAARVEYKVAGGSATGFELVRGDGSRVAAERTAS
ncbi:MAG TPA: S41 family peptidase [Allosphingosinicella sp.]|nr:S41 family peptidase [Allosphingosinicella sp.]